MSVKLRFDSSSDGTLVQRSRSFTGFSSLTGRRRTSSARASLRSRVAGTPSPRMHQSPGGGGGATRSLRPEHVEGVFQALRRGLKDLLEGHQVEMDVLSSQQRETKRNSRLAFLYDLEKEIRALERYIRRLEFHLSKVDELYETYCVQWRLCQGAINMKRAFASSPSTRASRDSLLELHRNHRHSLQDMSIMEGELEVLLGELNIKMKGLIGFARLCPGDQYEVVVRLGRQRWRIRGRIQSDDTQWWDEEEMIFLPHIQHNFEIKVTEAKGLGWLLVGMVTCSSADFFTAKPQLMLVDVTELGTIKLQLEVAWNPFDSSEKVRPLSISRQSTSSRKSSVYSWTAPSTPSFTEKYFISMVRELQDRGGGGSLTSLVSKTRQHRGGVSLLSYLSEPSHPSITSDPDAPSFRQRLSCSSSGGGSQTHLSVGEQEEDEEDEEDEEEEWRASLLRCSTPDLLKKNPAGEADVQTQPAVAPPTAPAAALTQGGSRVGGAQRRALAVRVGELMAQLQQMLEKERSSDKQLRSLEQQILHLDTILKNDLSLMRSCSSEETLAVEEVLGSFDFLSHDLNVDDDTSCAGSVRLTDSSSSQQLRSLRLLTNDSLSASDVELVAPPLTSGNWSLDQVLEMHLDICRILVQTIRASVFAPSRRDLLQDIALQTQVMDTVSCLLLEKKDDVSAHDTLPKHQRTRDVLMFWDECVSDSVSPFCCQADVFTRTLRKRYTHKLKAKEPGQSETVFSRLLQQVQSCCRLGCSPPSPCGADRVTVFQLSVYLSRWRISELGEHVSRLSREENFLTALGGPKRRRALNRLRGRRLSELLPLGCTLQTIALLQLHSNHKVCKAAARCLSRAADCEAFRSQAVVFYTESLKSSDVLIQQSSCLALKCLKATESVDHIADLCRSADEDLRGAAKETVLSFGKEGFEAFQRMDQLLAELQDEFYQNQETEITVL